MGSMKTKPYISLSKKPKNTPWVYSGDELGGLEKPK